MQVASQRQWTCRVCNSRLRIISKLYGVEGICKPCGLFFGRYMDRHFRCGSEDRCRLFKMRHQLSGTRLSIARNACKACRLARCHQVGMRQQRDLTEHNQLQSEIELLYAQCAEDAHLFEPMQVPPSDRLATSDLSLQTAQTIRSLATAEAHLQQFFAEDRQFHDAFLGQFASLRELLASFNHSFICNAHTLTTQMPELAPPPCEGNWLFTGHTPHSLLMEIFAVLDLFRAMPVASRLDLGDQVAALNEIGPTAVGVLAKWRSVGCNSEVIVYCKKRVNLLALFQTHYRGNETIQFYADYIYRRALRTFKRAHISEEEYLLLRAVILSHSAISGLSRLAQNELQNEAERYSRMLMHLVQSRLGGLEGAKRFAVLMHVAECSFHGTQKYREFINYMAMVAEQGHFHATMPCAFIPMLLQGSSDTNRSRE